MQLDFPEWLIDIPEIEFIFGLEEKFGTRYETALQEVENNIHIVTSKMSGIERREKILGITPLDTDSIEDRRFRVMARWNDTYPYTLPNLFARLNDLLGIGNYTLSIDYNEKVIICRLELTRKAMYKEVLDLMENIVPLGYALDIDLRYNQHYKLKRFTHGELKKFTHGDIRAEPIGGTL